MSGSFHSSNVTPDIYGAPAASMFDHMIDLDLALIIFFFALLLGSAGAIWGMLTRKMVILIVILVTIALFLKFHYYLPLPAEVHADIWLLKSKLWPW